MPWGRRGAEPEASLNPTEQADTAAASRDLLDSLNIIFRISAYHIRSTTNTDPNLGLGPGPWSGTNQYPRGVS